VHINVLAGRGGGMRFERISAARREQIHRAVREQHLANARRSQSEARAAREGGNGPRKAEIAKSSLAANHGQPAARQQQQTRQTQQKANTRQPVRRPAPKKPGER
jgi:hypothetical protein